MNDSRPAETGYVSQQKVWYMPESGPARRALVDRISKSGLRVRVKIDDWGYAYVKPTSLSHRDE